MTRRTRDNLAKCAVAVGVLTLAAVTWLFATGGFEWDAVLGAVVGVCAVTGGVLALRAEAPERSDGR